MDLDGSLSKLYQGRFTDTDLAPKNAIWKVLCRNFFQKHIPKNSTVVDIGAGYCEFINNIECAKKYAVDLNPQTPQFANSGVVVISCPSTKLTEFQDNSVDIVFMSNFLEHLKTKEEVLMTFREVFRILKKNGRVLVLQPNIRYLYKQYWDFFDHHIPLSDKSLVEVLSLVGFEIEKVLAKFLPFTTKGRLPAWPALVKLYLFFPVVWKVLGKQAFVIAKKP